MGFGGPIAGMFHVFFKSLFPFSRNLKLSSASTRILKNIAGYFVAFQNVLVETSALNNPGMHFPVRVGGRSGMSLPFWRAPPLKCKN